MITDIPEFYAWLNTFINFEQQAPKAFGLETIAQYAALFDRPQTAYKTAHIAGSKGKGSVAALFSALLTKAGFRTGLYTSPHLNDFRERITENGRFFTDEAYLRTFRIVQEQATALMNKPAAPRLTWFELLTLTAFVLFREERLDWAVIETGLGGRLDATNIVQPAVTLLTPIELEHCEYLGNTVALIAAEKAGIIKTGIPVFCARQPEAALAVFKAQAESLNAPFFSVQEAVKQLEWHVTPHGLAFSAAFSSKHPVGKLFKRPIAATLPLYTPVQAENAALAACAFKYLYPEQPESRIEAALSAAWLPGRFQLLRKAPLIVLDGAHTHNSIAACAETFFTLAKRKALLVFACARDKRVADIAPVFLGKCSKIYLTIPGSFKKSDLPVTLETFLQVFDCERTVPIEAHDDFESVLKAAFSESITQSVPLLITGSFYLAAEAQRIYAESGFAD